MENNGKHRNENGLNNIDVMNPFITPRREPGDFDEFELETTPTRRPEAPLPTPATERKGNPKRKVMVALIGIMAVICVTLGLYLYYGRTRKLDYQIAERQARKPTTQSPTGLEEATPSQTTVEAINQAKEELRKGAVPEPPASPAAAGTTQTDAITPVFPPYVVPEGTATNVRATGRGPEAAESDPVSGSGGNAPAARSGQSRYQGNSTAVTRSLYATPNAQEQRSGAAIQWNSTRAPATGKKIEPLAAPVPVPPFGARLPVRSMGAIYTLRDGGLAQFELTMDVSGPGWNLKRGTILVAKQQGSAHDRAYLSLVGFINPTTNRLVRLTGDLQGNDGAVGLKGKKRRIDSRWSSVFNRIATGGLALGQAALARGGATIIMPGASGIGSDFGLSQNALLRREFVEIPAGAPAYVLVTDLPNETKGVDSDPETPAEGTLTDEDLADLLSNGAAEEIRAALPRMAPEMRKLAQIVLGEK